MLRLTEAHYDPALENEQEIPIQSPGGDENSSRGVDQLDDSCMQ